MAVLRLISVTLLLGVAYANPSAMEVLQDMYKTCLHEFSVSCVQPKAMSWFNNAIHLPSVKITDELVLVKKNNPNNDDSEQRGSSSDIFDKFEDFLQSHSLVAKVPEILRPTGPLGSLIPRSFQPEDLSVPLAATGRSKIVKKVIVPFLLGLKFKTAVIVPLALALIALKTWKALTLGLLSLVLTGALLIFKLSKPKVATYEVVHYPHHHEHHVEHAHIEHAAPALATTGWEHAGYGRQLSAQELAYNGYLD